jgi:hypothetical protein
MDHYDVKRYALICEVNARIEGMKAANSQQPDNQPYNEGHFQEEAQRLSDLAHAHNEQL